MSPHLSHFRPLLLRLGIAMLSFSICRIIFYAFNAGLFPEAGFMDFFWGMYFDAATVAMMFFPFILLSIIPHPFRYHRITRITRNLIFHITNIACILLNSIDVKFIQFQAKRSTMDIVKIMSFGNDAGNVLPSVFRDYWWVGLMVILISIPMVLLYKKTSKVEDRIALLPQQYLWQISFFVIATGLTILVARGGFGLKPISVITASRFTSPSTIPLVVNTPFTFVKTIGMEGLPEVDFIPENELPTLYKTIHVPSGKMNHPGTNVVIFLMESYSTHYLKTYSARERSCAPFLDSLMQHSLWFSRAYANGKRSIEGTPSVMAAIPGFMPEPFITSPYNSNRITSFATVLKKHGYHSSYFHGATNGSMGFDNFTKLCGFDAYNGRTEFNDDRYFNGNWGIHDEEFFQFFANQLQSYPGPRVGIMFSITSHHPYNFPDKYAKVFNKSDVPMENAVEYADYALRKFMDKMRTFDWYKNTLFVFTADHTSDSHDPYYSGCEGRFRVPLIFFHPGDTTLRGRMDKVVSHIDVLPSVMDYLGYPDRYFSFGESVFEPGEGKAYMIINDIYQLITKDYIVQFAGEDLVGLFNYNTDSLAQHNLMGTDVNEAAMKKKIQAIIQTYNNSLIRNKMYVE